MHDPALSAWAWEPFLWRDHGERLLATATRAGIGLLYVTLPIDAGHVVRPERLEAFLSLAAHHGVQVAAVEGDPRMALTRRGLELALHRAAAIRGFQERSEDALAGVQYDVEPYASHRWRGDRVQFERWAEALERLARTAGTTIDVALPGWLLASDHGRGMLDRIAASISGMTVMAYRTDLREVIELAAPMVGWAAELGLAARVALECGAGHPSSMSFNGDASRALRTASQLREKLGNRDKLGIALHGLDWTSVGLSGPEPTGLHRPGRKPGSGRNGRGLERAGFWGRIRPSW